ncbi:ABC transporter permease [Agarivorans sp.]|uniref:ABC transporter permease n=1 Tax=Agarivorans sp. TaxID=1872412 RepID=UPI003D066502
MSADISWLALASFSLILVVPLGLNHYFKLALAKDLISSLLRMLVQLVLIGLYLQYLFQLNNVWLNLGWLTLMLLVGASAIVSKAKLPQKLLLLPVLAGLVLGLSPVLLILLLGVLQLQPWYHTQYLIPLAGMLLGNSLSGNIVALQRLFSALSEQQIEYQGYLALGANRQQATESFVQSAMQQALAPLLASMSTVGLVTLPGMMTGQILGGSDPLVAVKYQILILVAILVMLCLSLACTLSLSVRLAISPSGLVRITRSGS